MGMNADASVELIDMVPLTGQGSVQVSGCSCPNRTAPASTLLIGCKISVHTLNLGEESSSAKSEQ